MGQQLKRHARIGSRLWDFHFPPLETDRFAVLDCFSLVPILFQYINSRSKKQMPIQDAPCLPPSFTWTSNDPFYYGPATCELLHYKPAAFMAGIIEFVVLLAGTVCFWREFSFQNGKNKRNSRILSCRPIASPVGDDSGEYGRYLFYTY